VTQEIGTRNKINKERKQTRDLAQESISEVDLEEGLGNLGSGGGHLQGAAVDTGEGRGGCCVDGLQGRARSILLPTPAAGEGKGEGGRAEGGLPERNRQWRWWTR
jgi:hypothetical protein